jgi:phosphopantetheine adenylyltransferase
MQPLELRKKSLLEFLGCIKPSLNVHIELVSRCSNALSCAMVNGRFPAVGAIVAEAEPESLAGCQRINQLRLQCGQAPLPIIRKKSNRTVSSTDLREYLFKQKQT